MIYPSRSVEQKQIAPYADLLELNRFKRVYLDELPESEATEVQLFNLLIASEKTAGEQARKMAQNASVIELDLIEQILTCKFLHANSEL